MVRRLVLCGLLLGPLACDKRALPVASDGGGPTDMGVMDSGCPATPPALAGGCDVPGQICPYNVLITEAPAGTRCLTVYRCDQGFWLQIVGCGDEAGCPADPPGDGSGCSAELLGLDCFYGGPGCSESGIVQCDGASWRPVNGCPERTSQPACDLRQVWTSGHAAFELENKQLDSPALAVAGTQLLVAFRSSAGGDGSHQVYAHLLDTSTGGTPPTLIPQPGAAVGRDAVGGPALAFVRDRFTLAWAANDGWPGATNHVPGTFTRALPLEGGPPGPDTLVDGVASGVSALALRPGGGWLASRFAVQGAKPGYAVALTAFGATGDPVSASREVVADESGKSPWFAPPIPVAMARVVPWRQGFAVATPVSASGDLWDDSGIALHRLAGTEPSFAPQKTVRLPVGFPTRLSIAALPDDSVVVAYRGEWDTAPAGNPLFRIKRVTADGSERNVTTIQTRLDGPLGAGPVLVPFDQGYVVGWTTGAPGETSGTLRIQHYRSAHDTRGALFELPVMGLRPTDRLALAYAPTDRSLHVAFSAQAGPGWSRIYRLRLICGAPR